MLSRTLKEYKNSYNSNLSAYLKEYEDNTEASFLEIELTNYTKYYNSLIKISNFFENSPKQNIKGNSIIDSILSDLKNFDQSVFDEIVSIGKSKIVTEEDEKEGILILGTIPPSIDINFEKLENHITSAKRILEFITTEQRISLSPNKNTIALNLTGDLPHAITKQQPVVPKREIHEAKTKSIVNLEKDEVQSLMATLGTIPKKLEKKIPAKWYALKYLLELKVNDLKPATNYEGNFIRSELENIGKQITGLSGQSFYRAVLRYNETLGDPILLEKSFGKDWRNVILKLSNKNTDLKDFLDKYYS